MFVCAERGGTVTPVGTAFLIGLPGEHGAWFQYFVTANHVVRDGTKRWIRFRRFDGGPPEDKEVGGWIEHPTSDLAIAPCDIDTAAEGYIANWQEEEYFCDKFPPGAVINLGERAYFVGLLAEVESMAKRAIPMMRAAVVGAMYAEDVPMRFRLPDGSDLTHVEPQAHLIDTYSRSGFSGSPVYVEHPYVNAQPVDEYSIAVQLTGFSALFGVLVGHFGSRGDNAGIAVVVPVDALRELLEDTDLVQWRERKAKQLDVDRERQRDENAAIADFVQPESEFERFEDLTTKLLRVPKKELDDKLKES